MNVDNTRKSLLYRIQGFMASYRGKVILNYAYSWGAAIVILGTLFKLTHLPGANMMLWIGMGTEVIVFFFSAFDLPVFRAATPAIEPAETNLRIAESSPHSSRTDGGYIPVAVPQAMPLGLEEATADYLAQLREVTETLGRFAKNTESMSHDSEQMSTLNKNLTGINAIYEMQLRSVSSQIGTIDQVHEQTRKMARQIEELNAVYARILEAMNASNK